MRRLTNVMFHSTLVFTTKSTVTHRTSTSLSELSAKLHYTDTGYGHHQRTSSQQFYNLLYNKFTTNGQKFATSEHLDMSRCWALALRCGKFVVELLRARPLVVSVVLVVLYNMSVAGVRVMEFGPYADYTACCTSHVAMNTVTTGITYHRRHISCLPLFSVTSDNL